MTRLLVVLGLMFGLASCGADGEPIKPTTRIGVGVTNSGVSANGSVGLDAGPVKVNVGLF